MTEQTETASIPEATNVEQRTSADDVSQLEPLSTAGARAESLIAEIEGHAQTAANRNKEMEQGRLYVEQVRAQIDGSQAAAKEATQALQQHVEAVKATINELTGMLAPTQTTGAQIAEIAAQASAALESIRSLSASATAAATSAEAMRAQVEQASGVVVTKSAHIEDARVHSDDVRAKIDTIITQAQQSATNAEAQHQASRATVENVNVLHAAVQSAKGNIDNNAEAVAVLKRQCEEHTATAKHLAEIAESTESKVKQYEARLAELELASADRLRTIEGLLPGATSAGLASAFEKRSATFQRPEKYWQLFFIGSLAGLLGVALWQVSAFGGTGKPPEWLELARMLLNKVPLMIPLVWLALHASRQASLAKRMEEEYGFKATISTSFEGYRRQMAEIDKDLSPNSPLGRLCAETLRTIGTPPGRIYDKHRMDPTPGTALAESVRPIAEGIAKAIPESVSVKM